MAAARGNQRSKDLAIQERLMSYKAGREDLARQSADDRFERQMEAEESRFSRGLDAKGTQFGQQMDLLERKVDAAIKQNDATSMREAIRAASSELKALLDQGMAMSQEDADRVASLRAIINEFYGAQGLNMTPTSQTSNVDFASLKR
jgi:DNA anti-recombination protein RmuC